MKTVEQFIKEVSPFGTITVGNPKFIEALKAFIGENDFSNKTTEQKEEINESDLRELAHFYGGWKELRAVIDMLEDNENEAAWERSQNDYDRPSASEQAEMMHRIQRDLK